MCGGIGSRFWPYSRTDLPKQFIDFMGMGRSLLQMSYDRMLPVVPKENILVLTNAMYVDRVREQLPDLDPSQILAEPARRNTAPCIAWAAWRIGAMDPEASMIVTPSDHLISGEAMFVDNVRRGFEFVESRDALLTLGIKPVRPETGYGYIQVGEKVADGINKVKTFTEKPDLELAKVLPPSRRPSAAMRPTSPTSSIRAQESTAPPPRRSSSTASSPPAWVSASTMP